MQISITEKTKTRQTRIDSAFLKANTTWKELLFKSIVPPERTSMRREIKIKLEVDTYPPGVFFTDEKAIAPPFFFLCKNALACPICSQVKCMHCFSGNGKTGSRAATCLTWNGRYGATLHLGILPSGDLASNRISQARLMELLEKKIMTVSFSALKEDILPFIPDPKVLGIRSARYFMNLLHKLQTRYICF